MQAPAVRVLSDLQLAAFDHDCITDSAFENTASCLRSTFPNGKFFFLDVGGGRGFFADRVLTEFPLSRGIVLDNAASALQANVQNDRKGTLLGSGTELGKLFPSAMFDIVFFNFVLHHFVTPTTGKVANYNAQVYAVRRAYCL